MSKIQWTEETWNPVVGCTPVSPGCLNCYAATLAPRLAAMGQPQYAGLTVRMTDTRGDTRAVFNGTVRCVDEALDKPLRRKKPTMYFVCSMGDLFHKAVPFEFIDRVFAVMALCPQHTFQVLTKRPERMAEYLNQPASLAFRRVCAAISDMGYRPTTGTWPLAHVWLGTSAEDQTRLDERVPHLLRCPAAVRFLSCEPLLGALELADTLKAKTRVHMCLNVRGAIRNRSFDGFNHPGGQPMTRSEAENALFDLHAKGVKVIPLGECDDFDDQTGCRGHRTPGIDWVIVGGESGVHARPCRVGYVRNVVRQCREAGVPVFVKQLGAVVWDRNDAGFCGDPSDAWDENKTRGVIFDPENDATVYQGKPVRVLLHDRKGGDMDEWPADLRVREMPAMAGVWGVV
jgi:protein gp37